MPQVYGFFFKAVIQAVLIFSTETWMVTPRMGTALGGFQTQVERRLTVQLQWRITDGTWKYILTAASRDLEGLLKMEEYVRRRQNTVTQYIATRSLLDLCEGSKRDPGAQFRMWLWEQSVIDLAGAREEAEAVE